MLGWYGTITINHHTSSDWMYIILVVNVLVWPMTSGCYVHVYGEVHFVGADVFMAVLQLDS